MITKTELLERFEILSKEYIGLLNDKDVLENWGKPQLEALYATRVGIFQIEVLQLKLQIKALKRKIELVRQCIVNDLQPDLVSIELKVLEELAEAELEIMEQAAAIDAGKNLLANLSSPRRSAELRQLFRELAFKLHPDVNSEQNEQQKKLWHLVKDAYKTGDLTRLKALKITYEQELTDQQQATELLSEEELLLRTEVLKEGIRFLHEEIEAIRREFPFDIEEQIKDEEWVAARKAEIQQQQNQLQEYEKQLNEDLANLIRSYE